MNLVLGEVNSDLAWINSAVVNLSELKMLEQM
jgi:hypothetical protein